MQPIYLGLIVFAVVGYIGIRMFLSAGERASSLEKWADRNKYTFKPEADTSIGKNYSQLSQLTVYQNCSASNVVRGSLGTFNFCAFDFVDVNDRPGLKRFDNSAPAAISFSALVVETDLSFPPLVVERLLSNLCVMGR